MNNKYDMIIFDVDGTLCNTVDVACKSLNEALKKNNINKKVDINDVIAGQGMNRDNFAKKCIYFLDEDLRKKVLIEADKIKYDLINDSSITIYENVRETIKMLSEEYLIAIASNCGAGYVETIMKKIGISNFVSDYIEASYLGITKAEAIKRIIKRNNVKKAIYVGDTLFDKESCDIAGVNFILASYGFGKNIECKYKINVFNELSGKIKEIERQ